MLQRILSTVLSLAAVATAMCAAAGAAAVALPADFSGDRIVMLPRAGTPARMLRLWADTDGIGYLPKSRAAALGARASTFRTPMGHAIPIAILSFRDGFPAPLTLGGGVPLVDDDATPDPLHAGLDGQLGYSWFAHRRWLIDYRHRRLALVTTLPQLAGARSILLRIANPDLPSARVTASIDGGNAEMTIDLGAAVQFSAAALRVVGGYAGVQGTSFATHALVSGWHAHHRDWPFVANAGTTGGISAIRVPMVWIGAVELHDVWFTTRPDDDVFGGDSASGKLGGSAFRRHTLGIDYVGRTASVL